MTSTATFPRTTALVAATGLALAAAAAPAMSEATARAEAPSITVQHEGTEVSLSTEDVDAAGWFWDNYSQRSLGCWILITC